MILSMSWQVHIFLLSFLFGVISGVFYDIIRIFRRIIKHNNIFIQIEDGVFWLITSILFIFFLFDKTYGEIRAFLFLGMFCGMIVYYLSVSKYFMEFFLKIIRLMIRGIKVFLNIIYSPFLLFYKIICKIFSKPIKFVVNWVNRLKSRIKNSLKKFKKYGKIKDRDND